MVLSGTKMALIYFLKCAFISLSKCIVNTNPLRNKTVLSFESTFNKSKSYEEIINAMGGNKVIAENITGSILLGSIVCFLYA